VRVSPRLRRWLTGSDSDPSVQVRFWSEVDGRGRSDARLRGATHRIGRVGWAAELLAQQWPDGHWATPHATDGDLYRPKYIATNWNAIVLADLGMTRSDRRIRRTAELLMARWGARGRDLSGQNGEVCVTGNAVRTLVRFGYLDHPVVQRSIDWLIRAQKGDGGWHCFPSRSGTLDGWEGLAAFAEIPADRRTTAVRGAVERGAEFYLERQLRTEGEEPYAPWFRIHYPNHYFYDLLVGLRTLTRLGYGADRRLRPALRWLESKRAPDGSWALDNAHPDIEPRQAGYGYTETMFPMILEQPGVPSRWATVEALSVLRRVEQAA
jgi:hypothetical protein